MYRTPVLPLSRATYKHIQHVSVHSTLLIGTRSRDDPQTEIEHLNRFVTAYAFFTAEQSLQTETAGLAEMDEALASHKKTVKAAETNVDNLKQNIDIVKAKREAVSLHLGCRSNAP